MPLLLAENGSALRTESGLILATETPNAAIFEETFTGLANGAAWPAARWSFPGGGVTVQNEMGELLPAGVGYQGTTVLRSTNPGPDLDVYYDMVLTSLGEQYPAAWYR